jgi:hypothetical protein
MNNNGTGMDTPPNSQPSGAVTSQEATRKNPSQGRFKSGIQDKRTMKIDRNRHGIRRETTVGPRKTKPKKV